jgi:hypothetical protein
MTPKEKAEKLFDKFNNPDTTNYPYVHNAQQCALIAVDEIICTINMIHEVFHTPIFYNIKYWKEVKKEIQKL